MRQKGLHSFFILISLIFLLGTSQSMAVLDEERANHIFNDFIELYRLYGGNKYMLEEPIIQSSHVLQAAYIAQTAGAPDDIVIGLLFHDVGQIIDADRIGDTQSLHYDHDELGALWLKEHGFPEYIWKFVRYHTLAKVELCALNDQYYNKLSKASQESYHIQKSKYAAPQEQHHFEIFRKNPAYWDYLNARKCDDMAKIDGFNTAEQEPRGTLPGFEAYRDQVVRVLSGKSNPATNPNWKETIESHYQLMATNFPKFAQKIKRAETIKR